MNLPCSKSDFRFLELAAKEAQKSTMKAHKHGCVAVASGKIIAKGYNHYRLTFRDNILPESSWSCHAEMEVLRKCLKANLQKKKITLYVVRIDNYGNMHLSQPCVDCYNKMKEYSIRRVVYSVNNNETNKLAMKDFHSEFVSSGNRAMGDERSNLQCKVIN